jgi:DnaJ-class molecular chaperone
MNYYEILGLTKKCNRDDIKKAYHKLSLKFHPDLNKNNSSKFLQIKEAYDFLIKNHEDSEIGESSYSKIFSKMFKDVTSNKNTFQKVLNIAVSLEEALFGFEKNLEIIFEIPCHKCNLITKANCSYCLGLGYNKKTKSDKFIFKPIEYNFQSFIYPNYFEDNTLIIKINIINSATYRIKGADLIKTESVNIFKYILGGDLKVNTPYGDQIIAIPEGGSSDYMHLIEKKGLAEKGNLYIKFNSYVPKNLTNTQKDLLNRIIDENK